MTQWSRNWIHRIGLGFQNEERAAHSIVNGCRWYQRAAHYSDAARYSKKKGIQQKNKREKVERGLQLDAPPPTKAGGLNRTWNSSRFFTLPKDYQVDISRRETTATLRLYCSHSVDLTFAPADYYIIAHSTNKSYVLQVYCTLLREIERVFAVVDRGPTIIIDLLLSHFLYGLHANSPSLLLIQLLLINSSELLQLLYSAFLRVCIFFACCFLCCCCRVVVGLDSRRWPEEDAFA